MGQAGGVHHLSDGYVLKSPFTEQAGSLLQNPFMFCGGVDDDVAEAMYSKNRLVPTFTKSQITPLRNKTEPHPTPAIFPNGV